MRVVALGLVLAVAACGIGLEGSMTSLPEPVRTTDADASAPPDASLPPPPACAPVVVNDPLTAIDPATWRVERDGSNGDYPKIVAPPEAPLPSPTLSLVISANDSRGGLWLKTQVPTRAFDVSFSVFIRCAPGCADGLAVAWLKAVDPTVLDSAASGRGFGIPPTIAGGAVAIDLWRNAEPGDGPVPTVELLAIDGMQTPGYYPWIKATGPADTTLVGALRKVSIRARNGQVEARIDDVLAASSPLMLGFPALFGITAASGGEFANYYVRDFSGSFYDCDP